MTLGCRVEIAPRPFGNHPQLPLDVLGYQPLCSCAERYVTGERQIGQAEQILVFDKNPLQRSLRQRRQSRRSVDGLAGLGGGVELDDDAFYEIVHDRYPTAEALRASSAVLAAKRSRRAAMRWLRVPIG